MSELNKETYYGKISGYSRAFNKLDPNEVREAIEIVQAQFGKKINSKVDIPYVKQKKEPIEYVIEESKEVEI